MLDGAKLPAAFVRSLCDVHDDAEAWLEALPETLRRLEAAWGVRATELAPGLLYNVVAYAERRDGDGGVTPCVLKLSPPSDERTLEGEALALYAGDGICRLLARDDAVSALLLERIAPGVPLQDLWTPERDDAHTRIAAELMRRLWRPVSEPHPFCPLTSWARALREPHERISEALRHRAQGLLPQLRPDTDPVLLHADLHHGNILTAGSEPYRAIDPKGIVGARGYDVGTYLLNPVQAGAEALIALAPRRLATFSETLGLDESELAAWGFVHAVLSACWDAKMQGDRDLRALEVARALESRV